MQYSQRSLAPWGGGLRGVAELFNEHAEFLETMSHTNGDLEKVFDESGTQGSVVDDRHLEKRGRRKHSFGGNASCSLDSSEGRKAHQN